MLVPEVALLWYQCMWAACVTKVHEIRFAGATAAMSVSFCKRTPSFPKFGKPAARGPVVQHGRFTSSLVLRLNTMDNDVVQQGDGGYSLEDAQVSM